jgi:CDP-glucose 4,6-dehydratase
MKKKVFITGASGLIGTSLVELLLIEGYEVIGFSKSYPLENLKINQFLSEKYIPLQGDITDIVDLENKMQEYNPEIVIHLAAQAIVGLSFTSTAKTFDVNIRGTWNVLEAAKNLPNIERIILASSDKAYGEHKKLPYKEEFKLNAIFPYDISKKIAEEIVECYHQTYNLPIIITRCGNVFGPYDLNKTRIIPNTILSCLKKEKIVLRSDGKQRRCYIYSKDVAKAYIKLIETPIQKVRGEIFNIGNSNSLSVNEVVKLICDQMEIDFLENVIVENISKNEIQDQSLNCNKAKEILNWFPEFDLDSGIEETISWYKKNIKDFVE